ncbi:hypothetical protein ACIPF8_22950 [Collimonas sp. NPDC087041]|uniref:hypothetical protein n=1 Tax=Collimonas sp. NPDC087041 TaxID=3363960 RepID=UPI00382151B5
MIKIDLIAEDFSIFSSQKLRKLLKEVEKEIRARRGATISASNTPAAVCNAKIFPSISKNPKLQEKRRVLRDPGRKSNLLKSSGGNVDICSILEGVVIAMENIDAPQTDKSKEDQNFPGFANSLRSVRTEVQVESRSIHDRENVQFENNRIAVKSEWRAHKVVMTRVKLGKNLTAIASHPVTKLIMLRKEETKTDLINVSNFEFSNLI